MEDAENDQGQNALSPLFLKFLDSIGGEPLVGSSHEDDKEHEIDPTSYIAIEE